MAILHESPPIVKHDDDDAGAYVAPARADEADHAGWNAGLHMGGDAAPEGPSRACRKGWRRGHRDGCRELAEERLDWELAYSEYMDAHRGRYEPTGYPVYGWED